MQNRGGRMGVGEGYRKWRWMWSRRNFLFQICLLIYIFLLSLVFSVTLLKPNSSLPSALLPFEWCVFCLEFFFESLPFHSRISSDFSLQRTRSGIALPKGFSPFPFVSALFGLTFQLPNTISSFSSYLSTVRSIPASFLSCFSSAISFPLAEILFLPL